MAKAIAFICGSDDFLVGREGRQRWEAMTAGLDPEFGVEVVDGQAATVEEAQSAVNSFASALQTMPMFGDRKAVWFKNLSFLGETRVGKAEGGQEAAEALVQALDGMNADQISVLITAFPVDRRRRTYKWLQSNSDTVSLDAQSDAAGLAASLEAEAKRFGKRFARGAAEALAERVGCNTRVAVEEVRKLATFLGESDDPIDAALITRLVPVFGSGDFFEAVEAFYSLDLEWTLDAIHRHFFSGYDGRPMISGLQGRNRLMIQLKVLQDAGALGPRVSKDALANAASRYAEVFGGTTDKSNFNVFTQNPWYLGRLAQPLQRLKLKQLIDFQTEFLNAFGGLLDHPKEQERVMREVAIRCLS